MTRLKKGRYAVYKEKLDSFEKMLAEEKRKRLAERKQKRKEERRNKWIKDKQAEQERIRNEQQQ